MVMILNAMVFFVARHIPLIPEVYLVVGASGSNGYAGYYQESTSPSLTWRGKFNQFTNGLYLIVDLWDHDSFDLGDNEDADDLMCRLKLDIDDVRATLERNGRQERLRMSCLQQD